MKVGYARVSTEDQSLDIQLEALKKAGCEEIFSEKVSGLSDDRPELQRALQFVRKGDELIITRVDRMARSVDGLLNTIKTLKEKQVDFSAIEQPFDTKAAAGRMMLTMLGAIAEFEMDLRRDRQLEGISKAKAEGKYKGRKAEIDPKQVIELIKEDLSLGKIAKKLDISRTTVHRIKKKYEQEQEELNRG